MHTVTIGIDALRVPLAEQLAKTIGSPYQAQNILDTLTRDARLAQDLPPREPPDGRFGIVLEENLSARIRAARSERPLPA